MNNSGYGHFLCSVLLFVYIYICIYSNIDVFLVNFIAYKTDENTFKILLNLNI